MVNIGFDKKLYISGVRLGNCMKKYEKSLFFT